LHSFSLRQAGLRRPIYRVTPPTYYDHGSVLKFIEVNWHLNPLSARSRDNLPNPVARR